MNIRLPPEVLHLRESLVGLVDRFIAPHAAAVDAQCRWPEHSLRALGNEGMLGLHVPRRLGGLEQGLTALSAACEIIGRACPSSALCYGMHCVGTAVLAAKATPYQEERYLDPIARGRHLTTLGLSEFETAVHFYFPRTELSASEDAFAATGAKHFVTNGGYADSYVISTKTLEGDTRPGEFNCLVLDGDAPGIVWLEPWEGVGMRGNASRGMRLEGARIPKGNLLGAEGDHTWYVFQVVLPYLLMAMAGTYLGVAQGALDLALERVRQREYEHSGEGLAEAGAVQQNLADAWMELEKARSLVFWASRAADSGDPNALVPLLSCKIAAGEAALQVTELAMRLCGGWGYRANGDLARLWRDARAAHVMAPSSDILRLWTGRALLDLPLL